MSEIQESIHAPTSESNRPIVGNNVNQNKIAAYLPVQQMSETGELNERKERSPQAKPLPRNYPPTLIC